MWKKRIESLKKRLQSEQGIRWIVFLGIAGLACILISGFLPDKEPASDSAAGLDSTLEETAYVQTQAYCREMEARLTAILEQVEGVGTCEVMLTASGTSETVYAQDETTQQDDTRRQLEQRYVILSDDAGERALVEQIVSPSISGVIVVCSGAASGVVQERVTCAVQAVLALPASRICVVPAQ